MSCPKKFRTSLCVSTIELLKGLKKIAPLSSTKAKFFCDSSDRLYYKTSSTMYMFIMLRCFLRIFFEFEFARSGMLSEEKLFCTITAPSSTRESYRSAERALFASGKFCFLTQTTSKGMLSEQTFPLVAYKQNFF